MITVYNMPMFMHYCLVADYKIKKMCCHGHDRMEPAVKSVPIATNVVSSNPPHDAVYLI